MKIGYARVSTEEQNLDSQIDALKAAGCGKIYSEKITGSKKSRPELEKLFEALRENDVVIITKYDRLSRSLRDLMDIVGKINEVGAGFQSLAEDIDTTTPAGRLTFHIFGSFAEFERERISERTKDGLVAAKKRGRVGGRKPRLSPAQITEVKKMSERDGKSLREIADLFGVSHMTVKRVLLPTK